MTDPTLTLARERAAYSVKRGALNGYCDEGSIVKDCLENLLREQMEENIPDD